MRKKNVLLKKKKPTGVAGGSSYTGVALGF